MKRYVVDMCQRKPLMRKEFRWTVRLIVLWHRFVSWVRQALHSSGISDLQDDLTLVGGGCNLIYIFSPIVLIPTKILVKHEWALSPISLGKWMVSSIYSLQFLIIYLTLYIKQAFQKKKHSSVRWYGESIWHCVERVEILSSLYAMRP